MNMRKYEILEKADEYGETRNYRKTGEYGENETKLERK